MAQTLRRQFACGPAVARLRTSSDPPESADPRAYRPLTARVFSFASVAIGLTLLLGACGGGDAGRASSSTPMAFPVSTASIAEPPQAAVGPHAGLTPEESGSVSASDLVISAQPRNVDTMVGQAASFSVTASGAGPLQYQWQIDGVDIAGARAPTYTTQVLSLRDSDAVYAVVVSHGGQRVTSIGARLTVNPGVAAAMTTAPSITSQPRARTAQVGQTATFFVRAESSGTPAYQWQRNRTPIPGATGASYTTGPAALADNGSRFSVVLRNGSASTTSADALLTVTSAPTASRSY